jgi:alpha-beta hydrolase superfamily lysophospholipase
MVHRHGWLGSTDATRLFWQAWEPEPATKPPVVLVHGAGEHSGRYAYLAERLVAEGHAVFAMDHRGHGRSDGPRAMIDRIDRLVADLRLFVARVQEETGRRPFLVGHSLGGAVSLTYALRHGDTVEALVLSGPAVATEAVPAALKAIVTALSAIAPKLPVFQIDAQLISRDPEVVRAYGEDPLNYTGKLPARTLHEMLAAMDSLPGEVGELRMPLLAMHGSEDALCPPAGSRMVHDGASSTDKTLKIYDGLYHEIFNEPERDRVIDDLAGWLAERSRTQELSVP